MTPLLPPENTGRRPPSQGSSGLLAGWPIPATRTRKNAIYSCASERIDGGVRYGDYPGSFPLAGHGRGGRRGEDHRKAPLPVKRPWRSPGGDPTGMTDRPTEDLARELATVEHEVVAFHIAVAPTTRRGHLMSWIFQLREGQRFRVLPGSGSTRGRTGGRRTGRLVPWTATTLTSA